MFVFSTGPRRGCGGRIKETFLFFKEENEYLLSYFYGNFFWSLAHYHFFKCFKFFSCVLLNFLVCRLNSLFPPECSSNTRATRKLPALLNVYRISRSCLFFFPVMISVIYCEITKNYQHTKLKFCECISFSL